MCLLIRKESFGTHQNCCCKSYSVMLHLHIAFLGCCGAVAQEESSKCPCTCWLCTLFTLVPFALLLWSPISSLVAFFRALHLLQAPQTLCTQPQFSSQPKGMKQSLDLGMFAAQFHLELSVCCLERPGWTLPECLFSGYKCLLVVLKMRM